MGIKQEIHDLPLHWFRLKNIPGIPIELDDLPETAVKLLKREKEMNAAKEGLTNQYTVDGYS